MPEPVPGVGEVRVRVACCGVCHTELDEIEGRTAPPRLPVVPGHEVIGVVDQLGEGATKLSVGTRVGVGWIHSSSGGMDENVSPAFRATGRDANGGYAEYMTVPEDYAYPIPAVFGDAEAAPLLCAGAVGYRALRLTGLKDGERLGLTGFGGSAHLVLQLARHQFPKSEILCLCAEYRGARVCAAVGGSVGGRHDGAVARVAAGDHRYDAGVDAGGRGAGEFAARRAAGDQRDSERGRRQGGAARLSYHDHLWMEREIKTVANVTQFDIREFLAVAAEIPIRPEVTTYRLVDANQALVELKRGQVMGAKVLVV